MFLYVFIGVCMFYTSFYMFYIGFYRFWFGIVQNPDVAKSQNGAKRIGVYRFDISVYRFYIGCSMFYSCLYVLCRFVLVLYRYSYV